MLKRCEINGKICLTEKQAQKSINAHRAYGKYLRKYICPLDGYWHLTHLRK